MAGNPVKFDHKRIESNWKSKWYDGNIYAAEDFSKKPKKYILAELPYPSGKSLHIGHMMRYTVPEIYSRFLRMRGYNVLFPMGWDSFGLPAETYAQKAGITPQEAIAQAAVDYKAAMQDMGYAIDWNREINTSDPEYYKWTQWTFKKLWEKGLAIQKEMPVWWCQELGVLADEEVLPAPDGVGKVSERGGYKVERKQFKQWVLDIPAYADRLIADLDKVDYQDSIKAAQKAWIGRKEGTLVDFTVAGEKVTVFTTRPDTILGVTFLAISPEHQLTEKFLEMVQNKSEVEKYVSAAASLSDMEKQTKEKTGVLLKGISAIHPFGEVSREIPVFVADYILAEVGTGAVMGVPAHDERDGDFAKKYSLELIDTLTDGAEVIARLEKEGKGKPSKQYKIRPQVFSRQRYWGEPIPLIYKEDGTIEAVADEDLPIGLPQTKEFTDEWINTVDSAGKPAKRETDTMPTWAGSNWYYLRYIDPKNDKELADHKKAKYWMPVDMYFGTAAHTTAHLLYSRFWFKFLFDIGAVPMDEPYMYRMSGGILLGLDNHPMSKTRGNVINPQEMLENYGADAVRISLAFLGPYEGTYPWNPQSLVACYRLVKTIYEMKDKVSDDEPEKETLVALHNLIKNVTEMSDSLKFNTVVSEIMIFTNHLKTLDKISKDVWRDFIKVIAPSIPFTAEELWSDVGEFSVHLEEWPTFDPRILEPDVITIPVQINGKVRATVDVGRGLSKEQIREKVMALDQVKEKIGQAEVKDFVYVPDKIVNIVLATP